MSTNPSSETCTIRRNVTMEAWVRADFPVKWWEYSRVKDGKQIAGTEEDLGRLLEAKCREFEEFLRDHRSQDIVSLTVERKKADVCSACGAVWEGGEDETTGDVYCESCGATLASQG